MHILLTNDDGVYAPGLAALETQLRHLGDVSVVAPATEQSGVGHSITFLTPLVCNEIWREEKKWGTSVEGSPADCVKLGISTLCEQPVDVVVSGINNGLNAGINVLYSGTVAAAIEGAFFGRTSFAVSLEYDPRNDFLAAAVLARNVIRQVLERNPPKGSLFNINIPSSATEGPCKVHVVPMATVSYGSQYIKRKDPKGRDYYWSTSDPPPKPTEDETDVAALSKGIVTVSPLQFDLTDRPQLRKMSNWELST